MSVRVTWDQVFAWRLRRQFLDPVGTAAVVDVVRRLCGVQAQVASTAELAVALRVGRTGAVADALGRRTLVKTWAMRGTLHVLPPDDAGAYLSLLAAGRSWERPSWQRVYKVTPAGMRRLADVVAEELDGNILSRDELIDRVVVRTRDDELREQLRSGWGTLLKPLAWQGLLCHGPGSGNRVTFTRPDTWLPSWGGIPEPDAAATIAIPAYLRAHGPATVEGFDRWLTRGVTKKPVLRSWWASLDHRLATVDVEGTPLSVLAEDVDDLASTGPTKAVRLVPGFDQYVLGPGTQDAELIPPRRRGHISKAAGWIAPVVLARGRVAGVWETDGARLDVTLFAEAGSVPRAALAREMKRLGEILEHPLELTVTTET